jgi:hypothetical protein
VIAFCKKPKHWKWGIWPAVDEDTGKGARWLVLGPIAICLPFR